MRKKNFILIFWLAFPLVGFTQGSFFDTPEQDGSDNLSVEEQDSTNYSEENAEESEALISDSIDNSLSSEENISEDQNTDFTTDNGENSEGGQIVPIPTEDLQQDFQNPVILADRVKIRVNNLILTERQLSIFFALRKMSPSLGKLETIEEIQKEMLLLLGMEAYAKLNNVYNLLPTKTEMDKRVSFFNEMTQSASLAEAVAKIDPAGALTTDDIRLFFYYQILREKSFVFALQRDFINKVFTPREDELLLTYKEIIASNPKAFANPTQLFLRTLTIVEPPNKEQVKKLSQELEKLKKNINNTKNFDEKEQLFIRGIKKYSSSHLRKTEIIGPLDESLINQDFPEYKSLFDIPVGGMSTIIIQDGFIRLVFIQEKNTGDVQPIKNPDIRQRLMGMIYDSKGSLLFHAFLEENLNNFDVSIMDNLYEQ